MTKRKKQEICFMKKYVISLIEALTIVKIGAIIPIFCQLYSTRYRSGFVLTQSPVL